MAARTGVPCQESRCNLKIGPPSGLIWQLEVYQKSTRQSHLAVEAIDQQFRWSKPQKQRPWVTKLSAQFLLDCCEFHIDTTPSVVPSREPAIPLRYPGQTTTTNLRTFLMEKSRSCTCGPYANSRSKVVQNRTGHALPIYTHESCCQCKNTQYGG
jgi:hypothetical protein